MGTEVVPLDTITADEGDVMRVSERQYLPVPLICRDFRLDWRHLESGRQRGMPLELGPAAAASAACAREEDEMIFRELLDAKGSQSAALGDWDDPGSAFAAISAAIQTLVTGGFHGPFAVVLSPSLYAKTQRVSKGMGRLESKLISDVAEGGLLRSPVLVGDQGLVVAQGAHNLDIAVAQDLVTAYLGPEGLDHTFRVMESAVLRVKRPGAICILK